MKRLSLALGLALALALGGYIGFAEIASGIGGAGLGVLAVIAFHPIQMIFSALAWQVLLASPAPGLIAFTGLRWIREGVNNLLPVAQIGGEVVGARLLRRHGVSLAAGGASVTVDLTIEFLTQVLFTSIGFSLLITGPHEPGIVPWPSAPWPWASLLSHSWSRRSDLASFRSSSEAWSGSPSEGRHGPP
jgi:hypothetical protein